jgi:all-trans-8'-apo-beta-carotenal 15,15'-oxygenase
VGESTFIPHPDGHHEDDGWLLTLVYDASDHHSFLVISDAKDLTTLAKLHLKHHIPHGFHGSWTSNVF